MVFSTGTMTVTLAVVAGPTISCASVRRLLSDSTSADTNDCFSGSGTLSRNFIICVGEFASQVPVGTFSARCNA